MDKPAQWALVGAAWFLALSVAVLGYLAWRHFEAQGGPGGAASAAAQGAESALQEGASAVCPVTKERLVITKDTPHVIYKDRVYYFSKTLDPAGHEPKRLFLMDPEFYAAPGTPPLADRAVAETPAAAAPTAIPAAPTAVPTAVPSPWPTLVPTSAPKPIQSPAAP